MTEDKKYSDLKDGETFVSADGKTYKAIHVKKGDETLVELEEFT